MEFKSFSKSRTGKSNQKKGKDVLEVVKIVDSKEYEKKKTKQKRKIKLKNSFNRIKTSISTKPELKNFLRKLIMLLLFYFFGCIVTFGIIAFIFGSPIDNQNERSNNINSILLFIFIGGLVIPLIVFLLSMFGDDSVKNFLVTVCILLTLPFFGCIFFLGMGRPFLFYDFLGSFFLWFYIPYILIYLLICSHILDRHNF